MPATPDTSAGLASTSPGPWRKSTYSGDNGNCVECRAVSPDQVTIRDSKHPGQGGLTLTRAEFTRLLMSIRSGAV
jgi:hypothetical protein